MCAGRFPASISKVLLTAAVGLAALLGAPSGASASARPGGVTLSRVDTIQLGPLTVADGFSLWITAQACGSADPYVQLAYVTGSPTARLSHTYSGMRGTCSIQSRPAGAQLAVSVPGFVSIAVHIDAPRSALAHPGLPVGCGPPYGPELATTAVGRVDVAIHPSRLGRVAVTNANAQIFPGAPQTCPALAPTGGRELTADIGSTIVAADQPVEGPATLDILDVADGDDPAPGIQGVLGLQLSGRAALAVDASTGAARLGALTPLTTGSLSFTPVAACPGASAQNGVLGGSLTIADPLLGLRRIIGADADSAYTGMGAALPGSCNGLGSEPVEPELIDTCNDANAGCSLSTDSATATFFDETSAGTQAISGETIDFGDGSAPVAISNYGATTHAYAGAGTYTASLSVTDATGTVSTVSTPVVIDP